MSAGGVDSMGEIAAGLDLAARQAMQPGWDRRPGDLDPARVDAPVAIAGKNDAGRWMVLAMIGGFHVTMPPAAARTLAGELLAMADLCEGERA